MTYKNSIILDGIAELENHFDTVVVPADDNGNPAREVQAGEISWQSQQWTTYFMLASPATEAEIAEPGITTGRGLKVTHVATGTGDRIVVFGGGEE